MLRTMILSPLVILAAAVAGVAGCHSAHLDPHLPQMRLAIGIMLLASLVGVTPVAIQKSRSAAAIFQSAFLGTVAHLGLSIVLSIAAFLAMQPGRSFVWWMLAFYWLTLITLCAVFVRRLQETHPPAVVSE